VREALTSLLSRFREFSVVATDAADMESLVSTSPNVLLLDVGLRDQDSLAVTAMLKERMPEAFIILMDLIPVNEEIVEYVSAGVSGFVLKDTTLDELVATIHAVAAGTKVLPPRMTETLFSQIAKEAIGRGKEAGMDDVRMTRREGEVIELIGEGLSNKEIAQRLNIATHTVKSHVRNVMEKLALHTRLQIAAYSHREGLS
jgi:DNA-binding NarL/FixJ family response regulator